MYFTITTLACGYYFYHTMEYLFHRVAHKPWSGYIHAYHSHHHTVCYPPKRLLAEAPYITGDGSRYLTKGAKAFIPPTIVGALVIYKIVPDYYNLLLIGEFLTLLCISNHLHSQYHIKGSYLERFQWFQDQRAYHLLHHQFYNYNFSLGGYDTCIDKIALTYRVIPDKKTS